MSIYITLVDFSYWAELGSWIAIRVILPIF